MSRTNVVVRGALLLGVAATIFACNSDANVLGPNVVNPLFTSYVAIGNSITAGFQSDGINDSTQNQSYAVLVARQMGTRFGVASLSKPGCAPPINNFQNQTRVTLTGAPASTATTCALRSTASVTSFLNNVAVPGARSADPTQYPGPDANTLTQLILGGKSQVARALEANPSFATIWIGNNDILSFAISGLPAGATPQATFVTNYAAMITQLLAGAPQVKGVLIGVVQVANIPVMFTSQALLNPAFVGALSAAAGKTITVDPTTCTTTNTSLIGIPLIAQIKSGALPPIIACAKTPTPPIGDIFVLDAAEQVQVTGIVNGYNTYIKAKADSIGFAYYDPNVTFAAVGPTDPVLVSRVPNVASPTATFGKFFSLDGIHPNATSHILVANELMAAINAKYGTHLVAIPTS